MVARVLLPSLTPWMNMIPSPPRATIKAPNPTFTALAPTDTPASCLTSRLRLMHIGGPSWSPASCSLAHTLGKHDSTPAADDSSTPHRPHPYGSSNPISLG